MTMESSKNSESPKTSGQKNENGSTKPQLRTRPSKDILKASTPVSVACNSNPSAKQKKNTAINVLNVKAEHLENDKESNFDDEQAVVLEDPLSVQEVSDTNKDMPGKFEEHFVKVEAPYVDNDPSENEEDDVEIIGTKNASFKPSISVKRDSELKANCEGIDVFVKNDPVFGVPYSKSGVSGVQKKVVCSEDENVSSDQCYVVDEESSSDEDVKPAVVKKSKFVDLLKTNLKRKSDSSVTTSTKKQKTAINDGKSASSSKQKQGQALEAPVPALGKLRNIIGSNFKKLKLNLNEVSNDTYDMKSEIGLSYKHEDPSLDSAAANLNADGTAYECPKCKANFKWKTTLKFHMFNHLEDKALGCDICFKLFLSPAYLFEHKKVHLNENHERNFNCQDCSGQFETEASLTTHKLSHAKLEQKHYVCNVCKEQFASLFSLNSHKAKHSSAIKFECKPCDLRFKTLKTLTKHIATHNVENKTKEK